MTAPTYCIQHDTYTFGECEGCADLTATQRPPRALGDRPTSETEEHEDV